MDLFHAMVLIAAFLCTLVAGFLFAYAIVIMPGIKYLNDQAFIQAFQVTDRIIQDQQPLFILVWLGSALALLASAVMATGHLIGSDTYLLYTATLIYLLGVQLPTVAINIPLNNTLQRQRVDTMSASQLQMCRQAFEARWNHWNRIRTALASLVSCLLLILLLRL